MSGLRMLAAAGWLRVALTVLLVWTMAAAAEAQSAERIRQVVDHDASRDGFSGTVTYARGHQVIYRGSFGSADREQHSAVDQHTRFEIGSVSKQFTAAAILLLKEDGKLRIGDTVGNLLPGVGPAAWQGITVRQMLSHTSGIADYLGIVTDALRYKAHPAADLLAVVRDKPLEFKPGEGYGYSNTNYLLLGMIGEKTSGMPLCSFLRKRIFDPLQMQDSGCMGEADAGPGLAAGYSPVDPGQGKAITVFPRTPVLTPTLMLGAASVVSTGDDLVRWTTPCITVAC